MRLLMRAGILAAMGSLLATMGVAVLDTPAPAHAASAADWELPDEVNRKGQQLTRVDDEGNAIGTGLIAPGYSFFYSYLLENTGDTAITVTGFDSNLTIQMHPDRQGDYPADHCLQFMETRDFGTRQTYPQVIQPGEEMAFDDNVTYHYIHGPVSNECQRATFFFGPASVLVGELATPDAPVWISATCDASSSVTIPEITGVKYLIDGEEVSLGEHAATTSITVTAEPADGYAFEDGTETEWRYEYVQPQCDDENTGGPDNGTAGPDAEDSDNVVTASGDGKSGTPAVLAESGTSAADAALIFGTLLLGLGVGVVALRTRKPLSLSRA